MSRPLGSTSLGVFAPSWPVRLHPTAVRPLWTPKNWAAAIAAAVAAYRDDHLGEPVTEAPPVPSVGPLRWARAIRLDLAGLPATAIFYADGPGRRLMIIRYTRRIPTARDAQHTSPGVTSWVAAVDEPVLRRPHTPR